MTYLNDVTAVLLMASVVTFMIVCVVLAIARKEAREAVDAVTLQIREERYIQRSAS
jgi:hypothetical protein